MNLLKDSLFDDALATKRIKIRNIKDIGRWYYYRHLEIGVNRLMNVKASHAAHVIYFMETDKVIHEIFDRPIEDQPLYVIDTGCGDGGWLERIYRIASAPSTLRGQLMKEDPQRYGLLMIGVDYNQASRDATRSTLTRAGVPHLVIFGDINDPDAIARDLRGLDVDMSKALHVRSMLDHNRPYTGVVDKQAAQRRVPKSQIAFSKLGKVVPNAFLEQNLVEHYRRWAPYVGRFGLLVIELHSVPYWIAASNLNKTLDPAYRATHGYSDQYIVELDVFLKALAEVNLASVPRYMKYYPPDKKFGHKLGHGEHPLYY